MRSRSTFNQILLAVAPRNIQTLENEARAASALAATYPENEAAFRSLESEALRQIFHITVHGPGIENAWAAPGSIEARSAWVASSIVCGSQETDFRP
jgi:hypothetical protein